MCNENGGVIDDLIIYRISSSEFFLCVNASNTQRDFLHLKELIGTFDCCVEDVSSKYCLIAVQGPNAEGFLNKTFKQQFSKINRMQFCKMIFLGAKLLWPEQDTLVRMALKFFCLSKSLKNLLEI